VAYVLTVERSLTLEVRIAVFTAMSDSWRFIRQNPYFKPACGAFALGSCKNCMYYRKGRANSKHWTLISAQ
jgi:hypothetical protein